MATQRYYTTSYYVVDEKAASKQVKFITSAIIRMLKNFIAYVTDTAIISLTMDKLDMEPRNIKLNKRELDVQLKLKIPAFLLLHILQAPNTS